MLPILADYKIICTITGTVAMAGELDILQQKEHSNGVLLKIRNQEKEC